MNRICIFGFIFTIFLPVHGMQTSNEIPSAQPSSPSPLRVPRKALLTQKGRIARIKRTSTEEFRKEMTWEKWPESTIDTTQAAVAVHQIIKNPQSIKQQH